LSHEELGRLDGEVRALRQRLHRVLSQSPLLLPSVAPTQRRRVLSVVAELLEEAASKLAAGTTPALSTSELGILARRGQLFPWLQLGRGGDTAAPAMCDVRSGALRLAALVDADALASMLTEEFLPTLLAMRPDAAETLKDMVTTAVAGVGEWIGAKRN